MTRWGEESTSPSLDRTERPLSHQLIRKGGHHQQYSFTLVTLVKLRKYIVEPAFINIMTNNEPYYITKYQSINTWTCDGQGDLFPMA